MRKSYRLCTFFLAAAVIAAALSACQASPPAPRPALKKGSWFTAMTVGEGTRRIDDHGNANIYLVEGETGALVIDTGTGQRDLAEFVRTLTSLPVRVVVTHGHGDHAGGIRRFSKVYAHPADEFLFRGIRGETNEIAPITNGFVFDLGGRKLEVIETPGHTPGSIVLLDAGRRMLFAGDNNNSQSWLFLEECLPLEAYLKTLEKLNRRVAEFDSVLPGHNDPLPAGFIAEQIVCVRNILNGDCTGTAFRPYDHAFLCNYTSAGIVYDPDKLREKK